MHVRMAMKELLRSRGKQRDYGGCGSRCPDETLLAAYAEARDCAGRAALESHLAECICCRKQIAFLAEDESPELSNEVPARLLARACALVPASAPAFTWWRWAAPATATVCLILVLTVYMRERPLQPVFRAPDPPNLAQAVAAQIPSSTLDTATSQVRTAKIPVLSPDLVSPSEGVTVRSDHLEFRWLRLPQSVFYELQITAADGELLWKERTDATHLRVPDSVSLTAGQQYFAWVVAHGREGKIVKARAVSFKVAGPRE